MISFNKNLVISGIVGFIVNIIVAHLYDLFSPNDFATNSVLTVILGFIASKIVFAILFHRDYRSMYTDRVTGKINYYILKQIVIKIVFATAVFNIIDNVTKFVFLLKLLEIGIEPVQSAVISSIGSASLSYLSINLIVKYTHVFGSADRK